MTQQRETVSRNLATPFGVLRLIASDEALLSVQLLGEADPARSLAPQHEGAHGVLDLARAELEAYLDGRLRSFTVPPSTRGTAFQREVWAALCTIPFGEHRSYAWLAKEIGRPRAVRAVGAANGRNPLAIIVPCHRVLGSSGALTGYAGGLAMKRWLLEHEAPERELPLSRQVVAGGAEVAGFPRR